MLAASTARVRIARHDEGAFDRVGPHETVDDLQSGQDSARPVRDVEGKCAVAVAMRILGVGSDVLLDECGERGFGQVAVAVDARVDEKVDRVGIPSGTLQTGLRGRDGQVQAAVPVTPPALGDVEAVNHGAHGGSPTPRRR